MERGYLHTFYQRTRAWEYNKALFDTGDDEYRMFIFDDHPSYFRWYSGEIKEWLGQVWDILHAEKPSWFSEEIIKSIPFELIPCGKDPGILIEIGEEGQNEINGSNRSRLGILEAAEKATGLQFRKTGVREKIVSFEKTSDAVLLAWRTLAKDVYQKKGKNAAKNIDVFERLFALNKAVTSPLLRSCPNFCVILAHMLVPRFRFKTDGISATSTPKNWTLGDCKSVGKAVAVLLREYESGKAAMEAWRAEYPQLDPLFEEIQGLEEFTSILFKNLEKDDYHGLVYRVFLGATISIVDSATDLYVSLTYLSENVNTEAVALIAMVSLNASIQLMASFATARLNWKRKLQEVFFSVLLLRPVVDAYRVSRAAAKEEDISKRSTLAPL